MERQVTLIACLYLGLTAVVSGDGGEYCQLETFEGSCPEGKVILMQRARYGRMKLGRCLTRAYYVGCEANVLPQLDQRCSGRRHCHMTIPDLSILRSPTCPQDLVSYLEVEYDCIAGDTGSATQCSSDRRVLLQPATFGYLISEVTHSTGVVGTNRCPWEIAVKPGQRVRLTLVDLGPFHVANASSSSSSSDATPPSAGQIVQQSGLDYVNTNNNNNGGTETGAGARVAATLGGSCVLYATIRELPNVGGGEGWRGGGGGGGSGGGAGGTENVVCSSNSRETVVHTSRENRLSVVMHSPPAGRRREFAWGQIRFLLKYEVIGCADPHLPSSDVYLVRNGERVDVYCNASTQSWHLVCSNTQWVGSYGNCSDGVLGSSIVDFDAQNTWQFTYGIWFAVSAGIALGMAVGLGLLLVLYMHGQSKREEAEAEAAVKSHLYATGHFAPPDIARNVVCGADHHQQAQRACALYSCREDGVREHYRIRCLYDTSDLLGIET